MYKTIFPFHFSANTWPSSTFLSKKTYSLARFSNCFTFFSGLAIEVFFLPRGMLILLNTCSVIFIRVSFRLLLVDFLSHNIQLNENSRCISISLYGYSVWYMSLCKFSIFKQFSYYNSLYIELVAVCKARIYRYV